MKIIEIKDEDALNRPDPNILTYCFVTDLGFP